MWLRWLTHIIHERKQTMYNKNKSPLNEKVYLSSPTMHDLEMQYMEEAYKTNWMSTVGENINTLENKPCPRLALSDKASAVTNQKCHNHQPFLSIGRGA